MQGIPAEIRRLRRLYEISQADLARILHVHKITVSRWERGVCTPTWPIESIERRLLSDKRRRSFEGK